jgi:hypothetical protein
MSSCHSHSSVTAIEPVGALLSLARYEVQPSDQDKHQPDQSASDQDKQQPDDEPGLQPADRGGPHRRWRRIARWALILGVGATAGIATGLTGGIAAGLVAGVVVAAAVHQMTAKD